MSKLLAITAILLLLSSLLSSVQMVAAENNRENNQGKNYEENIWQSITFWENLTIRASIRVEISTIGLFGLSWEKPYALISFELKLDNYAPSWIEIIYEGVSGEENRRLLLDEPNTVFYFPPTQIRLDGSSLLYPSNTYRTKFTLYGENVSFSGRGEGNYTDTSVTWLKSKINWADNTISVEMKRESLYSFLQLALIALIFLFFLLCSVLTIKKTIGNFFISYATALGFVYLILAGTNMELMSIASALFWVLLWFSIFPWYFKKPLVSKSSKIKKDLRIKLFKIKKKILS